MSALGSLVVKLALEYAQFSKGLDDSEQDVKKHAKKVQDAYDRMAGGIENRITSLRDTVIGALAGAISVAGVVSAIGKVRTETLAAEQEQKQLAAALQSTGQAAGWSQEKLNAMADSLAKNSTFSAGELNQAQARLLSYTGIVGQTFPRAMQAAADMSARMGTSVTASAESIGRALDIPSAGLTALTQQGFRFTDAQKNMVQQLERTGRVAEAQAIILQALEGSYGGAAAAARDSLGGALAAVGETINGLMTADSASVPALRDSIEGLNDTLSSEAVRSAVQSLVGGIADLGSFAATTAAQVISLGTAVGEHSETIFALFSVIAGAGTALGIAKVVTALGGIAGGVTKVTAAWAALNVVMAANPAGLALMGLGAAVGGAYALSQNTEMQSRALSRMADGQLKALNAQKQQFEELVKLDPGNANYSRQLDGINQQIDSISTDKLTAMADVAKTTAAEVTDAFADMGVAAQSMNGPIGQSDEWIRRFGSTAQKAALEVAEWKRKMGDSFTPAMQAEVEALWAKQDAGAKTSAQSAKQLTQAYSNLKDSIAEKASALQQELISGKKLTESEKLRIKYTQDLLGPLKGLSAQRKVDIEALIDELEKKEKLKAAQDALNQSLEEELKHRQDWWASQAKTVEELQAGNKQLRDEVVLIGLTEQQQASVNAQRQETILLLLEQQLAQMALAEDAVGFMSRQRIALEQEIEARRELLGLMGQKTVREANAKSAKDMASVWEKTSQTIGQTLSDYIMGGGKDAATYLKRLFATLVLQPVVKYGVQGAMGMLGMGSGESGASGGGLGDLIGTGKNLYSAFTSPMFSNFGMGLASNVQQLGGTLFANGFESFGTSVVDFGNAMTGFADAINIAGNVFGYGSAIYNLSQGKFGAAAGGAIGTWFGGPIGAAIGSTLGGMVDGLFGKNTPHAGAASEYQVGKLIGGNAQTAQNLVNAGDSYLEQMQKPMDNLVLAIGSSFDALAKNYGKTSGYSVGAGFTSDNDDKSAGFFHLITPDGQTLDKWTISRKDQHYKDRGGMYDSNSEKGFDEYLKDVAFASLSGLGGLVPEWAAKMASSVKDSLAEASGADSITAFQNVVMQIAAIEEGFTSLGTVMPMFVGITDDMKGALLGLFGTMDNLTAATSSFYGLLYSEQERMTAAGNQVNTALKAMGIFSDRGGLDVFGGDAAKLQLRQAVEELMAAGNAELAGQLMAMTQSFVTVADYAAKSAQEAAKAAIDAYNTARDAAFANLEAAVGRERSYWEGIASAAQTAVSSLSSTLNLLTSNARDLYGTVDTTQQMLAVQGMVYIEDALAGVRGGASASNYSGLQDAITAARGGITGGRYASQFEKDRDALVLAGQLSQLGDLTGSQLSVEERSLKAAQTQIDLLDQTLDFWRELIDGNKDGNLSVVEAINQLAQAMGVTAGGPGGLLGGGGGASFGGGSGAAGTASAADPESFKYIRDTWLYDNHYARRGTNDAALDPLADLMRSFSGTGNVAGMLTAARDAGYRLSDVQAASTAVDGVWRASTYEQWFQEAQRAGIPAFAEGGFHLGGLRVVGERGWEVEATGPSRIWNQQQIAQALGGGNNGDAELVVEAVGLARTLQQQRATLASTHQQPAAPDAAVLARVVAVERVMDRIVVAVEKLADNTEHVTADGNAMATEIMNVGELVQALAKELRKGVTA